MNGRCTRISNHQGICRDSVYLRIGQSQDIECIVTAEADGRGCIVGRNPHGFSERSDISCQHDTVGRHRHVTVRAHALIGNDNTTCAARQAYYACFVGTVIGIQAFATEADIAEGIHRYGAFALYTATSDRYSA